MSLSGQVGTRTVGVKRYFRGSIIWTASTVDEPPVLCVSFRWFRRVVCFVRFGRQFDRAENTEPVKGGGGHQKKRSRGSGVGERSGGGHEARDTYIRDGFGSERRKRERTV